MIISCVHYTRSSGWKRPHQRLGSREPYKVVVTTVLDMPPLAKHKKLPQQERIADVDMDIA